MAALEDLMQKLSITQYPTGSEHWVKITHITDPSDFYVRPTAYKDYLPVLKRSEGPVDPVKLRVGSSVIFKPTTKKHHVRGQIRNIKTEKDTNLYDLFALDYGFIETSVPEENLKTPVEDCPISLALHCQLGDCQPKKGKFDQDAIEAMIYYIGTERAKMIIQGKIEDKYVVKLINTCPKDIATMLALTEYTCIGYGNNVISRMPTLDQPKLYFTYKKVKVGDKLNVRVQSGDSLKSFYVCEIEDYKQYIKEQDYERDYYHSEQDFCPENLKSGSAVAVYSDWLRRYERAVVTDVVIPEKKAVVQLVDWGTKMDIHMDTSRLKVLSREYYFIRPAMAIYCEADEKQVWYNELYRFLYTGHEFVLTINELGHQLDRPHTVTISKADKK